MKNAKNRNQKVTKRKNKILKLGQKQKILMGVYVICGGLLMSAAFLAYRFFVNSDDFRIKEVKICGEAGISQNQISAINDLCKGENIFKVNLFQMKRKITEKTGVEHIILEKDFPDRMIIRVSERDAIACFENSLIDKDGNVFSGSELDVPLIIGPRNEENLKQIAFFLGYLKEYDEGFYRRIQSVDYTKPRKVKICCAGWNLFWGGLNDLSEDGIITKLEYLKKVLQKTQQNNIELDYIDLRFLEEDDKSVIVKPL